MRRRACSGFTPNPTTSLTSTSTVLALSVGGWEGYKLMSIDARTHCPQPSGLPLATPCSSPVNDSLDLAQMPSKYFSE
jgi:hypothetical protein